MKKKLLFIDRDGTILIEPPIDFQVDSLEKLSYYPGVFRYLYLIQSNLDFESIMVTNQDGLGTASFPEATFWPAHTKMMETLANEDIHFKKVHIDSSFPSDNKPTRKPGIAMLTEYLTDAYDVLSSYVIGDRITDVELAKNLNCKAIFLADKSRETELSEKNLLQYCVLITPSWKEVYEFLSRGERTATVQRDTKETKIYIELNLDGTGKCDIKTGLSFFDHMLEQIGRHAGINLIINVEGDLHVDEHHTIEDTALALGECIYKALGSKRGIERYGFMLPMDDCMAQAAIDFGGRPWLVYEAEFVREKVGDFPTEMAFHFFKSFTDAAKCNLYLHAEGTNEHHKLEAMFKVLAKSIKMAIRRDVFNFELPTTKGVL